MWAQTNNVGRDHLAADAVDVLLNLGHPLSEHGEQLGNGGPRVQENLSALRLTWVKEGELCRVVKRARQSNHRDQFELGCKSPWSVALCRILAHACEETACSVDVH